MAGGKVVFIKSKEEWEKHKAEKGQTIIVDFTATWCGPCQAIGPYFNQLSDQHDSILFVKIDVDEQNDIAAEAGVSAMPTFQVYKDGAKVEELVGGHKEKLKNLIEKYSVVAVAK